MLRKRFSCLQISSRHGDWNPVPDRRTEAQGGSRTSRFSPARAVDRLCGDDELVNKSPRKWVRRRRKSHPGHCPDSPLPHSKPISRRSPDALSSRQSAATRDPRLLLGIQDGDTSESPTTRPNELSRELNWGTFSRTMTHRQSVQIN